MIKPTFSWRKEPAPPLVARHSASSAAGISGCPFRPPTPEMEVTEIFLAKTKISVADPHVFGPPGESGSVCHEANIARKTSISTVL